MLQNRNTALIRFFLALVSLALVPLGMRAQTWAGLHYTQEELAIWRQRATSANAVNYNQNGDESTYSPGDWARIKAEADAFVATPANDIWNGTTVLGSNYPIYHGTGMRSAAYCYLIYKNSNPTLANTYAAAARSALLTQILKPNTNISLWVAANVAQNGVFESKWITRMVIATDYLKDYLSVVDKTTLNTWFTAQAVFMANVIQISQIGQCFPQRLNNNYSVVSRDAKPTGETYGIWLPGTKYPDGNSYTHVNANGTLGNKVSHLASYWNNRNADKMNMVGMVGHLTNNASLIFQAKLYAKEWITYSVYPDGTMGEYERNGDYSLPQQGLSYGAINMWQYIMLAEACARKGDMELYNFSTTVGMHGTEVPNGNAPKNLRLVMDKYIKNIMGSPAIYYLNTQANNRLDSYGEVRNIELCWDALFAMPNKFYKSNYITSIYTRTQPGVDAYPGGSIGIASAANVWYPWGGTGAELPGLMMQYGQLEAAATPYTTTPTCNQPTGLELPYLLQRTTRFIWSHAVGALSYNLRYKPTASSTWTTVTGVLNTWMDCGALQPATQYEWQVQTVGTGCTSGWAASSFMSTPTSCAGTSKLYREVWTNQTGYYLFQTASLPFGRTANSSTAITSFEVPVNGSATNYVERVRGFICAPTTGTYYFMVAGDDEAELWLSPSDDPAGATRIAYTTTWTNSRQYNKNSATQKSAAISMIANQRYYIEARHRQQTGGDNLSVAWILPSGVTEAPMPGSRISPWVANQAPTVSLTSDKATYNVGDDVIFNATAADADGTLLRVEFYANGILQGTDTQSPYSYTISGGLPTGNYTLTAIAYDNKALTTTSAPGVTIAVGAANCTASGTITRDYWGGVAGVPISAIPTATAPTTTSTLTSLDVPQNAGDNYGQRLRGYICPPASGTYTFYISGDDRAELWLSTDITSANKARVAYLPDYTNYQQFTRFGSQQYSVTLVAGKSYYIEVLHKEATGGDHCTVGWTLPSGVQEVPIGANRLSPYNAANGRLGLDEDNGSVNRPDENATELTVVASQASKLSLFPNPAQEQLNIAAEGSFGTMWTVTLLTTVGQQVHAERQAVTNGMATLDLAAMGLKTGAYIVRVQDEAGNAHTLRFMKE